MKVDVIIPVFNNVGVLRDCLESILAQPSRIDREIIVVDDASTDPSVRSLLEPLETSGAITLMTNAENLGFTRTVNRAMKVHRDRDVVLLNSDTIVYGEWLDCLHRAACSGARIATANPLTNSNGSHISFYPRYAPTCRIALEASDAELSRIAFEVNRGQVANVHVTVGFCMYIKRACLDEIGYFDDINFPVGYGEESDFCYRAVKLGWQHVIAGDAFVTHLEGQTFGERKQRLMEAMITRISALHPELAARDADFRMRDPVRPLRMRIDLGRLRRLLAGRRALTVDLISADGPMPAERVWLRYSTETRHLSLCSGAKDLADNIPAFCIPQDACRFNKAMAQLGVATLEFTSEDALQAFERAAATVLAEEIEIAPRRSLAR